MVRRNCANKGKYSIKGDGGGVEIRWFKDTILRSTINDYFENEPVGRLTAWVYPPVTKNATLGAKRYPWSRFTFLKF